MTDDSTSDPLVTVPESVWKPTVRRARILAQLGGLVEHAPALQVCPCCLAEDGHRSDGVQFLRLRWQCSAMTICQKHLAPLQQACVHCHSIRWPVCDRTASQRLRFVCRHCGNLQEKGGWPLVDVDERALQLLARFENQLLRALANQTIDWCWIGHATAEEFLRLVEDLLWAITRSSYHSRPIYRLQTYTFPLCGSSLSAASEHWRLASPQIRRCLLATVLGIFGNPKACSFLHGPNRSRLRWPELLVCLTTEYRSELEKRSLLWPPAAHNALRRAAYSPRDKHLFYSLGGRPLSTDIGKGRRAPCTVY
jgi:hypothetical protein